ncbi:N-acetylmuramoyl-L-alanine amidase [Brevibacillus ruminantium]|uniref:N-acetylmuramoyl-L-alanine amidase n=1 Tax=Brevibacillus ruminantium TaxID=2950604 RepID=A0ABY4WD26_9BACL|nr:N-acetylmuramoyl-L-alanine amidase [Brevibacillus ruminantium]USG64968.1 N-acetylmuramoyl-L-alanine amidase [Brevibacillus ruminantium]
MADIKYLKVFVDPGHGGWDPGATNGTLKEKDLTLVIGKHVRDRLKALGATTQMSRETDIALGTDKAADLKARTTASNNFGASIFVSVHINSGGGTGLETWKHDNSSRYTGDLATAVQKRMVASLGLPDRKVKSAPSGRNGDNIYVIDPANNKAWAVLAEVGFIDHATDKEKLQSSQFLKDAGYAIADGINSFVNTLPPIE